MDRETKTLETRARRGIRKLRAEIDLEKYPEIAGVADSLEALLDGASKGGVARAKKLTKKRRREIAQKAAKARWAK
jgi:hypothetical protein